ncbi:ABC transporter substrate-binding protein [Streptomyces sp. NPDC088747]|uniref:ABC transporter substrate-binding protein n=1 Tax=Streptomyces sp. NPDC088747 TaxID=3365886 RepID=UPI0037FCD9F9
MTGLVTLTVAALALSGCAGSTKGEDSGAGSAGGALRSAPGFDADSGTFTVSAMQPLSGPLSPAGLALVKGMKIYYDQLNAKGGVDGKYKIKFSPENTQFNPQVAVPLYNRVKSDSVLFSGVLGTTIVKTLEPQITADDVTALVDSSSAIYTKSEHLLPWGTPTQINMVNLVAYAADKLDKKKATFCSVTSGDDLGAENRDGIKYAVDKLGVTFKADVRVQQGQTDFTSQVQQLQRGGCQVVLFGATTGHTPGVISASVQLGFDAQFLGQNNVYDPSFAKSPIAPYLQKHFLTTAIGVDWNSSAPGQKALREGITAHGKGTKPSSYTELGYAHAMLTEAILQKAVKNNDVSRAGILKASRSLGSFDYQGMLPTYLYGEPADRKPPLVTGIYRIDPKVPMGLAPVDTTYTSPLAKEYAQDKVS